MLREWLALPAVVAIVLLGLWSLPAALLVLAALFLYLLRESIDFWRLGVSVSLLASFARSPLSETVPATAILAVQFGGLALAVLPLLRRPEGEKVASYTPALLALLAGYALLSTVWSDEPSTTGPQAALFLAVAVFLWLTRTRRWATPEKFDGDLACAFGLIVIWHLAGIAAAGAGNESALMYGTRFQGWLSNPNFAGILAALGIILGCHLIVRRVRLWLVVPSLLFLFVPLFWSGSRGALIAAAVVVLLSCFHRGATAIRWSGALALVGALTTALFTDRVVRESFSEFFGRENSGSDFTSGRLYIWQSLIDQWQEHWFAGVGYGTYSGESNRVVELGAAGEEAAPLTAHNIFLSFLVELGLVGFVLLIVVFIVALVERDRSFLFSPLAAGVVAIAASENFESSITGFGNAVALTAWLIVIGATVQRGSRGAEQLPEAVSEVPAPARRRAAMAPLR